LKADWNGKPGEKQQFVFQRPKGAGKEEIAKKVIVETETEKKEVTKLVGAEPGTRRKKVTDDRGERTRRRGRGGRD